MPTKLYEVGFTRTTFIYYTVEALDEDSAEEKAREELQETQPRSTWDNWETESIENAEALPAT
tara:strand:+ start:424 stop:612 length:189 start_codon:yes stop_codon:yes gene_type:complete